ncbi:KTSC domain-containing protein [Microcoleus vaginatus DQ-U2]
MEVLLNRGKICRYLEVPKTVYLELMAFDSKGSYMRSEIIHCYPTNK